MNIALWIGQALLALVFAWSGYQKGTQPKERLLASGQTGVRAYSVPFIRFIAAAEALGALGLVLPWMTHIAPILTPLAAIGLGVIMLGAAYAHAKLHELRNVVANFALLGICAFVVVGRMG